MRRYVAMLVLSVLLVGCGGDPQPAAPPAPATPTGTTPTPVAAPTMPEQATKNTRAGAVEFVRYYVEVLNYAARTGNLDELTFLADRGCASCKGVAEKLGTIYSRHGHVEGGVWRIKDLVHVAANRTIRGWFVSVLVTFEEQEIWRTAAGPPSQIKAGSHFLSFQVGRFTDGWRVVQWSRSS